MLSLVNSSGAANGSLSSRGARPSPAIQVESSTVGVTNNVLGGGSGAAALGTQTRIQPGLMPSQTIGARLGF